MPMITDNMSTGQRIAIWRNYRGMTQEACAGLMDKSLSWWKKVEGGTRRIEKLSDLVLIARVLRVREITDLTGSLEFSLNLDRMRETQLLPPVRTAMRQAAMMTLDRDPTGDLRHHIDDALAKFHGDSQFVSIVGKILPDLILDATVQHRLAADRQATSQLSEVYLLTCEWCRHVSAQDLALTAVDRAITYAHLAGDPLAVALAVWQTAGALKDAGRTDEALDVVSSATEELGRKRISSDASVRTRAVYGHLHLQTALMAAHVQQDGTAWRHWDTAVDIAHTMPTGYVEPVTIFNNGHPGVFGLYINIALGKARPAIEAANRVDISALPSACVRSIAMLNLVRGYAGRGDDVATFHVLMQAERESPETVAQSGHVREICREMLRRNRNVISRDLHAFAERIGLFA